MKCEEPVLRMNGGSGKTIDVNYVFICRKIEIVIKQPMTELVTTTL